MILVDTKNRLQTVLFADIGFDLQLFAGEKTEPATEKRRRETKEQGNIPKSQDLTSVIVLFSGFIMLRYYGPNMFASCADYMRYCFSNTILTKLAQGESIILLRDFAVVMLKITIPFMLAIILGGLASNIVQTGFMFRFEPFMPNIDRFNPVSGIQNIFSWKMVAELVKSIIKIIIVAYVPYSTIKEQMPAMIRYLQLEPASAVVLMLKAAFSMAMDILIILLVLAIADWWFQNWRFEESIKMSKDEIKDEYKQREGDPKVKQKIREKQRQAAGRRMLEEVPKATVVVTNPTHIACALKYEMGKDEAPVLVAMGAGLIAQKIKETAKENNIPIIENKPLARQMYKTMQIGDEIPSELYAAVAEILKQVYAAKNKAA